LRTKLLALTVTFALAGPVFADDVEGRLDFVIANPAEGLSMTLSDYWTDDALTSIGWLRDSAVKPESAIGPLPQKPIPAVCPQPVGVSATMPFAPWLPPPNATSS